MSRKPIFEPVAGPYRDTEQWMMDRVIEDLKAAGKPFVVILEMSNGRNHRFVGKTVLVQVQSQSD